MRISDWSSDVCSSDLDFGLEQIAIAKLRLDRLRQLLGLEPRSLDLADEREGDRAGGRHFEIAGQRLFAKGRDLDLVAGRKAERLGGGRGGAAAGERSEENTSELQSIMRISYAVFCLKKKKHKTTNQRQYHTLQDNR